MMMALCDTSVQDDINAVASASKRENAPCVFKPKPLVLNRSRAVIVKGFDSPCEVKGHPEGKVCHIIKDE